MRYYITSEATAPNFLIAAVQSHLLSKISQENTVDRVVLLIYCMLTVQSSYFLLKWLNQGVFFLKPLGFLACFCLWRKKADVDQWNDFLSSLWLEWMGNTW